MEHLWSAGPLDCKSVHRAVGSRRRITLNTVQSTMERLFRKGLLAREKVSHAYVYRASVSREALGARLFEDVVSTLMKGRTEPMLAAFVDVAERAGQDQLERLAALVAKRRAERKAGR